MQQYRVYITEASEYINRLPGTIRKWERQGLLPEELIPARDDANRRYWTWEQLDGILNWLEETDRRPGKALSHYKPSAEKIEAHVKKLRSKRSS